ncbi:MAG: methyl-accepting chemotaxis protein [Lachnospiraceae bacterium]
MEDKNEISVETQDEKMNDVDTVENQDNAVNEIIGEENVTFQEQMYPDGWDTEENVSDDEVTEENIFHDEDSNTSSDVVEEEISLDSFVDETIDSSAEAGPQDNGTDSLQDRLQDTAQEIRDNIENSVQSFRENAENVIAEAEELKEDVLEARKEFKVKQINSIKFRLIGGFIIPLLLIIALGVVSYQTASKAIIENYEVATSSTIVKTADYYRLMFTSLETSSKEMISNAEAKNYYSKMYKADITNEANVYNTISKYYQAITISNAMIDNIYVMCDYGKAIFTSKVTEEKMYDVFAGSDEAKSIDENRLQWVTSRPCLDQNVSGNYGVSLERQFYSNSTKPCGYLILDINKKMIQEPIMNLDLGEGSVVALIAPDGGEINNSEDGENYFVGNAFLDEVIADTETNDGYTYVNDGKELFLYSKLDSGFVVCALVPASIITAQASKILVVTIIVVILAAIIAIGIGGVLSLGIDTSIHVIMKKLNDVAQGDLTTQVKVRRKDEFRVLAGSINNMIEKTKNMIEQSADISRDVSGSAESVTGNAQILLDASRNITDAITGMEQGIIQQASDSDDCIRQMDVLAEKISMVADNTEKMSAATQQAKDVVKEGLTSIDELNEKARDTVQVTTDIITGIESMDQASKQIGSIIDAINEIADQTNLLSLNASIEAARAGEAGRGFAVVADEIRKLAEQSSQSANQIKLIVDDIEQKTKETVTIAHRAEEIVESQSESLRNTVSVFNRIEDQVGGLVNNIGSIQLGMEDIESAKNITLVSIQSISAVSEENAATVEEITATSEKQLQAVEELSDEATELSSTAEHLLDTISTFKIE